MKPNFLKRLWCFLTFGCDMQPKNFMTQSELKMLFLMEDDFDKILKFLKLEPYLECRKCGRVVK